MSNISRWREIARNAGGWLNNNHELFVTAGGAD